MPHGKSVTGLEGETSDLVSVSAGAAGTALTCDDTRSGTVGPGDLRPIGARHLNAMKHSGNLLRNPRCARFGAHAVRVVNVHIPGIGVEGGQSCESRSLHSGVAGGPRWLRWWRWRWSAA